MKLYKLTDERMRTKDLCQWTLGVKKSLPIKNNPILGTDDVWHAYRNINMALLLNPIHGGYLEPRLFEANGELVVEDWQQCGCFDLQIIKEINCPAWYVQKNIRYRVTVLFAILCAEATLPIWEAKYSIDDRPRKAINAAKKSLKAGTECVRATTAAADAAAKSSNAATECPASSGVYAAAANSAAAAAYVATAYPDARSFFANAADAVAASAHASHADKTIDFALLIDEAVKTIMEDSDDNVG